LSEVESFEARSRGSEDGGSGYGVVVARRGEGRGDVRAVGGDAGGRSSYKTYCTSA